ncbi:MAG: hypothetical protein HPY69_09675 [Armatimonadetes bacterium]|nr:hypothetical protein [Armatimonadota bacterium]
MDDGWLYWLGLIALLLVLLALAPRLLARLVRRLADVESRRLGRKLRRRLSAVNQRRRELGLEPFPSLEEFERLTVEYVRQLMPREAGVRRREPFYGGALDISFDGVVVLGDVQPDPELRDVVHLGEFVQHAEPGALFLADLGTGHTWQVHCGIVIYYGSFLQWFAEAPREQVLAELRETVAHELRHLLDEEEHVPLRSSLAWSDLKQHHRWQRWLQEHEP